MSEDREADSAADSSPNPGTEPEPLSEETHNHNSSNIPVTRDPERTESDISNTDNSSPPHKITPGAGFQQGYYGYQQATPPPNSPAGAALGYDSSYLLQPQPAAANFSRQQFGVIPPPPLSPGQPLTNNGAHSLVSGDDSNLSMGILAPSSPLFPGSNMATMEMNSNSNRMNNPPTTLVAPPSPSIQYVPGHPGSPGFAGGAYPAYGGYAQASPNVRDVASPDSRIAIWQERGMLSPALSPAFQFPFQGNSPQTRRTPSFDEMLPPAAAEDNGNNIYTAPGISAPGGQTMLSQPSWPGYDPAAAGQYPASPQGQGPPQLGIGGVGQRGAGGVAGGQPGGGGQRPQQPGGAPAGVGFYPATTPGPPIQTTHHNKGPDGANLFIFHIPNHFTNLDMWHLFCHYGNLLSVRIMVEKDTGRSRGFGFVSYDSPDAAAMAIKELNGFVIGNKRLKVQHKQIRQSDNSGSQQDNLQSPPLFPQMNNVHNMPPQPPSESGVNGIHGRNDWLGAHEGTETDNEVQNSSDVQAMLRAQQQHQQQANESTSDAVQVQSVPTIVSQNESEAANLGLKFDATGGSTNTGGGKKQHIESALDLDSIRDALPS